MAMTGYLRLEGMAQGPMKGDCTQKGYEGWILVYGVNHMIELPRDALSGMPTGQRRHDMMTITKAVDAASPLLYQACTTGEHLKDFELIYNRINPQGQEEQYFSVKLENAIVVKMEHEKPLTFLEENKVYHDMEMVSFSYTKITWHHIAEKIEASDDWNVPATTA